MALIEKVKKSLEEALANGESFATWRNNLPLEALQLPKNYQELVFRNAMQNSYNGAKWAHFRDNPKRRILRYVAVSDGRTRHAHKALHGFMADVDDPRWQSLAPSNGHNCRCTLMALTEKEAQAFGYQGYQDTPTWTDKNGVSHRCEPDKGWDYSPENSKLSALLREKEQKLGLKHRAFENEALSNIPLSTELKEKLLKSATKSVDFAGIEAEKEEILRLQNEGLRPGEAQLAAQWQKYFGVRLVGFDPQRHISIGSKPPDLVEVNQFLPENEWRTLDIMFAKEPKLNIKEFIRSFNRSEIAWNSRKENIIKHINKAHIVPMVMKLFDKETATKVVDFVLYLPTEQQEKIVFIWGD